MKKENIIFFVWAVFLVPVAIFAASHIPLGDAIPDLVAGMLRSTYHSSQLLLRGLIALVLYFFVVTRVRKRYAP